jgi:predicted lipoprotein
LKTASLVVLVGLLAGGGSPGIAQTAWRSVAVPYYTPPAFVQGLHAGWYAPRAQEFVQHTAELSRATDGYCAGGPLAAARHAWRAALLGWARISSVAIGPLVERRSARRIDFSPTRPALIAKAIARQPANAAEMETIGNPAKGFPALERLLWTTPAAPGSAACAYAVQVAADIGREALALDAAFDAAGRAELDEAQTVAAMNEAVNQWLAGLDAMRVQGLERPLLERRGTSAARPQFGRDASGASAAERAARWQALRTLAVFEGSEAPYPGVGLVPLEPYLRGKGLNPLADQLAAAVQRASRALDAASGNAPVRVQAAARQLGELKTLVEGQVATALDIRLGFSDADGD